jgi:ubiquinone/menaquinone biosynthesis C-methylase UbiE
VPDAPRTDYERIAPRYDEDRKDWEVPPDDIVEAGVRSVLDLGCGTGIWLAAQSEYFAGRRMRLVGADLSAAMLRVARSKSEGIAFLRSAAEALPFAGATFDYAYTSYAFHHFRDKEATLDEVARVLEHGGRFRNRHIDPWTMRDWWVYRFFPETWELDQLRFWQADRIASALERRGFEVEYELDTSTESRPTAGVLAEAERRVVSQLDILDVASYETGLGRMRALPDDSNATIDTEWGRLLLTATKR